MPTLRLSCLTGLLATILASGSLAQTGANQLLSPAAPNQAMPGPQQQQRIDALRARPTTQSLALVTLAPTALQGNTVTLAIPDVGSLSFHRTDTHTLGNKRVVWSGQQPGQLGTATFVSNGTEVTGIISTTTGTFRIEPLGGGLHAVIKVDQSKFPVDDIPAGSAGSSTHALTPVPPSAPPLAPNVTNNIDVVVIWTDKVAAALTDPSVEAELAVTTANTSFAQSQVHVHLNLVAALHLHDYDETGKTADTILSDAQHNDVNAYRNLYGADVAVLLTAKDSLFDQGITVCGISPMPANANNAVSIVDEHCAVDNLSFPHELAHLFGADHDLAHAKNSPYPYGHGYVEPHNSWRTIMAYPVSGANVPRLPYFSNPNVLYPLTGGGFARMGTAAQQDNARVLNENAGRLANFRSPPKLSAQGPGSPFILCSKVAGGGNPCVAVPTLTQPFQIGPIPEDWLKQMKLAPAEVRELQAFAAMAAATESLPAPQQAQMTGVLQQMLDDFNSRSSVRAVWAHNAEAAPIG